ncbi:class B sortase [Ethanoligenens harbinense]|uniref:Sortase, SrtB family n=1 Tax=Ethanoligenens harbinense (strain DSM 18485 / JCM 12961 / CGMCC 1.5033 / YUAN-3) TaxID=663278 RepID=E6U7V7_ETHHY|nr:class B sortase [Ethanoligenens harbinense]ADU25889.1 sortase, SrtB family [Ethanoligenens harbinense YUAN-3]AVQ95048.1 SrtB family sortase [Ethanoligenens harbinense YUAN-3]AYF37739.1 SrtB family sortase [Ethanoligenens harbinense]AYF40460.1 SrtB family sortase [Ethanoligenens harbinense]QCN91295.1 SrtB family sortase [Ethanoligenens harbinense]
MSKFLIGFQHAVTKVRHFVANKKILVSVVSAAVVLGCVSSVLLLPHGQAAPIKTASKPSSSIASVSSAPTPPIPSKKADILAAQQKNSDVVGWLTVPGTSLDMPIVHTTDNSYYLTHNLDKQTYKKGWPFLDYRNDAENLDRNSIIYGHNMGDGTLFGELKQFENLDFLNQHPVLYFGTADADRYWKIFAVYITDVNFYYINTSFPTDNDFTSLVSQMRAQSLFNTNVSVSSTDKILTLSTCTYEFENARFVIEARLVQPGESYDVTPATENPNPTSPHHKAN